MVAVNRMEVDKNLLKQHKIDTKVNKKFFHKVYNFKEKPRGFSGLFYTLN